MFGNNLKTSVIHILLMKGMHKNCDIVGKSRHSNNHSVFFHISDIMRKGVEIFDSVKSVSPVYLSRTPNEI